VTAHSAVVSVPAKSVAPGEDGDLSFTVENSSVVEASAGLDVTLRTDDPWVQFHEATRSVPGLPLLGTTDLAGDPLPFSIEPACPVGHYVQFETTVGMPEGDLAFPMGFAVGSPSVLYFDDFEAGTGAWMTTGSWGLTSSSAHSGSFSLTDSPGGNYPDQSVTSATLNGTFRATSLNFWHRYDIETGYDYGKVQVSAENGPWSTVASFTGNILIWEYATVDLSAFAGQDLAIRFTMETDYSVTEDGWYIDDVEIVGLPATTLALAPPAPVTPTEGSTVGSAPVLTVVAGAKSMAEPTFFGFRVYGDDLCTDLIASVNDVPSGGAQTSWTAPSLSDGQYWWRAWAGDGTLRTDLSQPVAFTVEGISAVGDVVIGGPRLRILGNGSGEGSRLELSLPARADVQVDIHDARGARIRRLASESMAGGNRTLVWDGRDGGGRAVSSGVYFVRVSAGREVMTGRMVIVR
jgi:hypothetical protein